MPVALLFPVLVVAAAAVAPNQQGDVPPRDSAERLVQRLSDPDMRVRWWAVYALGQRGTDAVVAVAPLQRLLENREEHEYVRAGAAWALGRMGAAAAPAAPLLARTLASTLASVRRNSTEALGNIGVAARLAADALEKTLRDPDGGVRVSAALALWKISRQGKALRELTVTLRAGGAAGRQAAVALGQAGAEPEAVAALVAALGNADADVRRAAARSLGQIGPAALPPLERTVAAADRQGRCAAVEAMGWIGAMAISPLAAALKNADADVRRAAARALGRLGPAAKAAEPALVDALTDAHDEVRAAAAKALNSIRRE